MKARSSGLSNQFCAPQKCLRNTTPTPTCWAANLHGDRVMPSTVSLFTGVCSSRCVCNPLPFILCTLRATGKPRATFHLELRKRRGKKEPVNGYTKTLFLLVRTLFPFHCGFRKTLRHLRLSQFDLLRIFL